MSEFNFNSQVATNRQQLKRLLALGLKKETADMHWFYTGKIHGWQCCVQCYQDAIAEPFRKEDATNGNIQPAWSLGRLVEMMPPCIKDGYLYSLVYDIHRDAIEYISFANGGLQRPYNRLLWDTQSTDPFDNIICCIDWLIKDGYFYKEYLENGN